MSANKKNEYKSFAVKLCAGGLTLAVAGLIYFYGAPKIYRASSRVKFVKSGWSSTNTAKSSFGPERLPEECQKIRSDSFLDHVITNLDLNAYWGKQLNQGVALKTDQSRERLKTMLDVHPAPGAIVIEIQATGNNPAELAKIVNEVTKLYADYRHAGRQKASHEGLGTLQARWEEKAAKAQDAASELRGMQAQFDLERTNQTAVYDQKDLEQLQIKRLTLEDEYVKRTNDYLRLKEMNKEELKDVLSSMETGTNTPLTTALSQVIRAKDALLDAERLHGADSAESKSAAATLQQRTSRSEELVDLIMSAKAVEATSLKATLERIGDTLEAAKHATNNLEHFAAQDAAYAEAKKKYDALVQERDKLEFEILNGGMASAMLPDDVEAQIVEQAEPPSRPESPDRRIVEGALAGGGVLTAVGLFLLVLLGLKPRTAEKKAG